MSPYDAYVNTAKMSMSDREVEAWALTKAALLLQSCGQNWDAPDRDQKLSEALEFNQKLWSIFQASLIQPDHPMAMPLRQDILSLGAFIDKRIFELMAFPEAARLTAIIEINQNLAAGLRAGASRPEVQPLSGCETREETRDEIVWA